MTVKKLLLAQLAACTDKNGWFVAMKSAVAGLTAEQAAWKPDASAHSIWQIVNHLQFWNERYLRRFQGKPVSKVGENAATFDSEPATGSETQWQAACARYEAMMAEWQKDIEAADDSKLAGPVRPDATDTWDTNIAQMSIHTAHHIGQIVTMRRAQGSWDIAKGVS